MICKPLGMGHRIGANKIKAFERKTMDWPPLVAVAPPSHAAATKGR